MYVSVLIYIYIYTHRGIGFHALQSSRRVIFSRKTVEISLSVLLDLSGKQTTAAPMVTGFFSISPCLSLSLTLSLSDFGRVGSAAEKRLTADDGQTTSAVGGYKSGGGAQQERIHAQKREHESTCVYTFTDCKWCYIIYILL